ncbi:hypothetical protein C3747_202g34 [Trypanosoma cruzi]|uniref:Uncharacterized protein n=2 Tax=Trypanosoma cruzi TaxID=5693 RepID=Q4DW11_TRYCC|nr:hypothetical protein, conserved [Trypanosoma cruzi]EAN96719.1 hypothetical protein, conserved [Trypanosoma cruzi]PWV00950.1 hypothetical protein C3747_202g34 [Trypanosoma cruzi]RNC59767.1 hypothetical protein TcCL_ESM02554 [Trypanosoma cruzi]|eukprot:XP_818570.1 hypothetical protein [Trypanosoma cruzi strain CL Brener]
MSDALAILDGAAACVSALLMPEELGALIRFLRGESWDEVPPPKTTSSSSTLLSTTAKTATTTTAAVRDGEDTPRRIPNALTGCYNYIPLAIAAELSLLSMSSSGERSALVQKFERNEFRVFAVNLLPESRTADYSLHQKGGSSSAIVRLSCMEAVRAWCDAVYAEKDGVSSRSPVMAAKRHRREETASTADVPSPSSISKGKFKSGPIKRRALFILSCCANESAARRGDINRSRRSCDPLMMFLHEISAIAALCRAREATHGARIEFSVLLLPDDLAYGGALLEEALREPLCREYCVQLFHGSITGVTRHDDAEATAFIRRLETWMNVPTAPPRNTEANTHADGKTERVTEEKQRHSQQQDQPQQQQAAAAHMELADKTRQRESSFFFVRRENLPLCCFLREALRRFPVILHPMALRQLQALWTTRRQLGDVVTGLHALLCPFSHSASARDRCASSPFSVPLFCAGASRTNTTANKRNRGDGMSRHVDTVDILNAILAAAGQLADGQLLNEAVAFAVLYEDIVWKRSMRLQRIPGVVSVLEQLWRRWGNDTEMIFQEALALCVPVYTPSSTLQNESYQSAQEKGAEDTRAVVAIPAAMRAPAAKMPLGAELMHSALLAVLPPQESLEELKGVVGQDGGHGYPSGLKDENCHDKSGAIAMREFSLSENNFFNPSIPDSVRLLHLLTSHALGQGNSRQKYVSFEVLQRICQISDETLVRALKELQLAGMVKLNGRELKARVVLDNS